MGRLVLMVRLAARDLRHHRVEACLLCVALTAATATLTLGLVLRGVTSQPYEQTRVATLGPDVIAEADPPLRGGAGADVSSLRAIANSAGVAYRSGPFPLAHITVAIRGRRAFAVAQGRDEAPATVDRPRVTDGSWALRRGIVVERGFAEALGIRVGDIARIGRRSVRVVGIAVTAALPPYPLNVMPVRGRIEHPGLVWTTRATALALDRSPSYIVNVRLGHPASTGDFVDRAILRFTPTRPVPPAAAPPPFIQSAEDLAAQSNKMIRDERKALLVGSWLLGLMALASIAVLVGGRMADQVRRVGLLKAVGASPTFIASLLLVQYAAVTAVAAAAGLAIGRLIAPLLARPSAGLVGGTGVVPFTSATIFAVLVVALGIAAVATFVPALRASRTSTVRALLAAPRRPRRVAIATRLSSRLPVPLLLGVRISARRPRRALLGAVSAGVAVTGIVTTLAAQAQIHGATVSHVPDPRVQRLTEVLLLIMILLVAEAAVTAIFSTTATVLDSRGTSALARALGATQSQVALGLLAAQILPALFGALAGVPTGMALFSALSDDATAHVPAWQLMTIVVMTVFATAALAAAPARLSMRRPIAGSLGA